MFEQFLIRKANLAQKLAITLALGVLVASLAVAAWAAWWNHHVSLAAFQQLAETNAEFVTEMRLPKSPELAARLATILNTGAGFYFGNGEAANWPPGLDSTIQRLAEHSPGTDRASGFEIAMAPLPDGAGQLILIRESNWLGAGVGSWIIAPALIIALTGGVLAFSLVRGVVRPIRILTDWLPNLDLGCDVNPEPIPDQIGQRQDEIGVLARSIAQTAQRLAEEQRLRRQSERLATLGRIATSLAHEIKNPAAAIAMHAALLRQTTSTEGAESVDLIGEEVERITDLVNQWLFVARSRTGRTEPHDLQQLLTRVARRGTPLLDHARVSLQVESEPSIIEADAQRIEQALRNLLINAAQAMPLGGEIQVRLSVCQDVARLVIEDEGQGFSEEALRRFGEAFFSEREGGMGIGLTLASEVVQSHGGKVWPENPDGGGARVTIEIPTKKSP